MIGHDPLQAFSVLAVALLLLACRRFLLWDSAYDLSHARIAVTLALRALVVNEYETTVRRHVVATSVHSAMVSRHLLRARSPRVIAGASLFAVQLADSTSARHCPAAGPDHL